MPNGLLDESSLRTHPDGLALALTLPWYRSLWLSSVSSVRLTLDGQEIGSGQLSFELAGTRYALEDLPAQSETLWYLQEHPLLIVRRDQPAALGERHTVQLIGELRLPYMQIAPGQDGGPGMYVPNFVNQTLELTVTDQPVPAPALTAAVTPPPPKADADPFSLGLTLYSASAEFRAGWYDFDGLLNRVAELGIGPGIEIVASQVLPDYPNVTEEFTRSWQEAFDKHGFTASSFGANLDMGRRRDRDMTPDEEYEFTETLFHGAKKLGFPLVRIQSAKPDLLRRLLPLAEKLELKLAYEIHAPLGPNSPEILKVRDVYAELNSPLLGFVADFSSTMHSMSPTLLRAVRRAGLDDEAVRTLQVIWGTDAPMRARQEEFIRYLRARDFDPARLVPSRIWPSTCTGMSVRRSGRTSCPRSCTSTPSSTTSTSTAMSRQSTIRSWCECSSRVVTAAIGPVSGRATLLRNWVRWIHCCWSASSMTLSGRACVRCRLPSDPLDGKGARPGHCLAGAVAYCASLAVDAATMPAASLKRALIHSCSESRSWLGCHHRALTKGVASKGSGRTLMPSNCRAMGARAAWISPIRCVPSTKWGRDRKLSTATSTRGSMPSCWIWRCADVKADRDWKVITHGSSATFSMVMRSPTASLNEETTAIQPSRHKSW